MPWHDSLRSALTIPIILGGAFAIAGPGVALYAALSALLIVLSERSGTTGQRMLRSGSGLAAGTLAMLLGPLTAGTGLSPLLIVLGFGLLSGVMSSMGSGLSWAAMQLLVQMSIAGGIRVAIPLELKVLAYVIGGVIALSGVWIQSALERTDQQYVTALTGAIEAVADLAAERSHVSREVARHNADSRLAAAMELILTARPLSPHRARRLAVYRRTLARIAILSLRTSPAPSPLRIDAIKAYGSAIRELEGRDASDPAVPAALVATMGHTLGEVPPIGVAHIAWSRIRDRQAWTFTARLLFCLLVAELLRQVTPFGHSYWILLTVALCLKPDFASVFSRTIQRGSGTILGVVIGWIATFMTAGYAILPVLAVLGGLIPWTVRRNYWTFAVVITPLVLLLLDYGGPVGPQVLLQRVANTVTGCLVVLVVGYALWPATWRPPFEYERGRVQAQLDAFGRNVGSAAVSSIALERILIASEIAGLQERSVQAASEPRPFRIRAQAWHSIAVELEAQLIAASNKLAEGTAR